MMMKKMMTMMMYDDNDDYNNDNCDVIDVRNVYYLIDIGGDGSLKNIMTQPSSKFFKRIEKVR
jgi:hypothetical protein